MKTLHPRCRNRDVRSREYFTQKEIERLMEAVPAVRLPMVGSLEKQSPSCTRNKPTLTRQQCLASMGRMPTPPLT